MQKARPPWWKKLARPTGFGVCLQRRPEVANFAYILECCAGHDCG
ncbi:hypothetical protein [Aquabacterium fontiphilum]|jgi:hypothetical protein|nr:hypothetical protein [Aquabacterium fontiphilum]